MKTRELIELFRKYIESADAQYKITDLKLRRSLTEAWFSNTLAWLLDPKGGHGLGVNFSKEFLRKVAKKRCSNKSYSRRNSHLKFGKSGPGVTTSGLSISNVGVLREFYLTSEICSRVGRGSRFCDVAFIDLDSSDGIFLVIENKLFSTNSIYQLQDYFKAVEEKYNRAKVREYVYLTLTGQNPFEYRGENKKYYKYWIPISWTDDILVILNKLINESSPDELKKFHSFLSYLNYLCHPEELIYNNVRMFRNKLIAVAAKCLHEELNRLGEDKRGNWKKRVQKAGHYILYHTSTPARKLYVEILSNFSIVIYGKKSKVQHYEKILIPFGAHPDQVFNLLDIAARDIYHLHFDNITLYLSSRRRLTKSRSKQKIENLNFLDFVYKYKYELQVLLMISSNIWFKEQLEVEGQLGQQELCNPSVQMEPEKSCLESF